MPSPWSMPAEPLLIAVAVLVPILIVLVSRRSLASVPEARWRPGALAGGALLLGLCWVSPLQTVASHYLLSAHLVQITLLMGVVPPLLLLGLPRQSSLRLPRRLARVAHALVHPVSGMLTVNAAFFGLHVSPLYDLSLRSPVVYSVQQIALLLASVMFWWPIVVPLGGRRVLSGWGTLGYILVATIPQTFAGITVALAKHAMYGGYVSVARVFGLSVMTDQQIAGASTALVSKIALFTAFSIVFARLLSEPSTDGPDDGGGGGGRRPPTERPSPRPSGSVPWLAHLNAGRTVPEPMPRRLRVPAGPGSRRR